jgi:ferrochelatase
MRKKLAVLVLNLGGPLVQEDVQGFLYNLFADKYIIGLPWGLRHGLAWLISTRRAKGAQANYAKMGGGSPLLAETKAQAEALEALLQADSELETKVFIGMRYWHPFIEDTAKDIAVFSPDHVVILPLYPQFSSTTTLTGVEAFKKHYLGSGIVTTICCYAQNSQFIDAQVQFIKAQIDRLGDNGRILFSAHGLPQKIVDAGDPYQKQVEATVALIMAKVGTYDHEVCYQSRVGPLKWIGPSTDDCIRKAGSEDKSVMVVPIAFVSEHIETLVELDEEYGHLATQSGVKTYVRIPTLRTAPLFIEALKDEVVKALHSNDAVIGDFDCQACHKFCLKQKGLAHV